MKKAISIMTVLVTALLLAPGAFAQAGGAAAGEKSGLVAIAAGFGMALAAFGGALGQSRVAAAACEGIARNPGATGAIRASMILGLVFIETLALLTLVIIFVKV
ncbi:MAG: ATP synthase F0 subunit C [Acidobacteriia bacterium]|nr:ATP synthase F0 subunit C [Terriglobia bacterium]